MIENNKFKKEIQKYLMTNQYSLTDFKKCFLNAQHMNGLAPNIDYPCMISNDGKYALIKMQNGLIYPHTNLSLDYTNLINNHNQEPLHLGWQLLGNVNFDYGISYQSCLDVLNRFLKTIPESYQVSNTLIGRLLIQKEQSISKVKKFMLELFSINDYSSILGVKLMNKISDDTMTGYSLYYTPLIDIPDRQERKQFLIDKFKNIAHLITDVGGSLDFNTISSSGQIMRIDIPNNQADTLQSYLDPYHIRVYPSVTVKATLD